MNSTPALLPSLLTVLVASAGAGLVVVGLRSQVPATPDLPFPGLLARSEREAGNPLATYAAMLARSDEYRKSKVFAGIFDEVRCNYEEFLGEQGAQACAGVRG